jgi:hypothetical protein
MYLREMGYEDVDWIQLIQGRVQWQAIFEHHKYFSWGFIKGGEFLD